MPWRGTVEDFCAWAPARAVELDAAACRPVVAQLNAVLAVLHRLEHETVRVAATWEPERWSAVMRPLVDNIVLRCRRVREPASARLLSAARLGDLTERAERDGLALIRMIEGFAESLSRLMDGQGAEAADSVASFLEWAHHEAQDLLGETGHLNDLVSTHSGATERSDHLEQLGIARLAAYVERAHAFEASARAAEEEGSRVEAEFRACKAIYADASHTPAGRAARSRERSRALKRAWLRGPLTRAAEAMAPLAARKISIRARKGEGSALLRAQSALATLGRHGSHASARRSARRSDVVARAERDLDGLAAALDVAAEAAAEGRLVAAGRDSDAAEVEEVRVHWLDIGLNDVAAAVRDYGRLVDAAAEEEEEEEVEESNQGGGGAQRLTELRRALAAAGEAFAANMECKDEVTREARALVAEWRTCRDVAEVVGGHVLQEEVCVEEDDPVAVAQVQLEAAPDA